MVIVFTIYAMIRVRIPLKAKYSFFTLNYYFKVNKINKKSFVLDHEHKILWNNSKINSLRRALKATTNYACLGSINNALILSLKRCILNETDSVTRLGDLRK